MSDTQNLGGLDEYDEDELVFHPDGRITRKRFLIAGGGAALGAAVGPLIFSSAVEAVTRLDALHLPYKAHTSVKGHLEFWHFWSSPLRRGAIHSAIKQFNSVYKNVQISDLPIPFGDFFDKIHAAVAAQSGVPDVVVADRPSFWNDARAKVYTPLTSYNAKDKVSGKVFFPFTWYESNVKVGGKTELFGLPFETDIRVMYANHAALKDAGLPSRPPRTWSELKSYADKLDQKSGDRYSAITFWPNDGQGLDNWVWANKGAWQNSKMYPTANSTQNVATGDWQQSWVKRYGGQSTFNYLASQNQAPKDQFGSGHLFLHVDTPTYQDFSLVQPGVKFTQKNGNAPYPYWLVSYIPVGPGGKPYTFSGGFAIGVPRNNHRSRATTDAAWEFTKFLALVGQLTFERFAGNIPCVISMTRDPFLSSKQNWSKFIAALKYGHAKDRNVWDALYPGDVEGPAQDAIIGESKTAKQALDAAQSQALANMKRNGGP